MSQKELAAQVQRSESWVSQVERDFLPVERLPVLQRLADVLGVAVRDLRPDAAQPVERTPDNGQAAGRFHELRLVLTGHPALRNVVSGKPDGRKTDIGELR